MSNERVAGVEVEVDDATDPAPTSPLGGVPRLDRLAPGGMSRAKVMLLPERMVKRVECEVEMMEDGVMTRAEGWGATLIRTHLRTLFTIQYHTAHPLQPRCQCQPANPSSPAYSGSGRGLIPTAAGVTPSNEGYSSSPMILA